MLPFAFYDRPATVVAAALLGHQLACLHQGTRRGGLITETEAYLHVGDTAAHSHRGPTHATRALRMGPGTLYIHAMRAYVGLDIVTADGSVLLRALQPTLNLPDATTLNGPGKLCRALHITRAHYGLNLTDPACPITLTPPTAPSHEIHTTTRIGLTRNTTPLLRFTIKGSPYLSR